MQSATRLVLVFTSLLGLAACNQSGSNAKQDFNAAGNSISNGANATGQGIVQGAHATGQAITGNPQ